MYRRFVDAGLHVLALWPILPNGKCGCGDPDCDAIGKHPLASNWQHSPLWSDDQLDVMDDTGQFATGYGVLVSCLLVVDIDERNGGAESYNKLFADVPEVAESGMIVQTGSGGASRHFYFSLPEPIPMVQSLTDYPGIDFKSSGYVVGPGSHHKSGGRYEILIGGPEDINEAPAELVEMLRKPDLFRSSVDGGAVDVSETELVDMLRHIPNNKSIDYEQWIRVGMSIHIVTGGSGYHLWETWSKTGPKHNNAQMRKKWGSFGKSTNPVTLGTLVHYAEEGGWLPPVTFQTDIQFQNEAPAEDDTVNTKGVDLLRPPGFVGKLTQWIESRNRHSRESLSVAAALCTISSVAGMRYTDPLDGITPNIFLFGVAGSATGKESVLRSHQELLRVAGVAPAVHGGIKSEQEIYKNLIRNQAAYYVIDELGEVLAKLKNARTKGTASYLEGVIGTLMSIYSKAGGYALITGDLKVEVKDILTKEYVAVEKRLEKSASADLENQLERIGRQLKNIDSGLENPYLNIFGLTTPERFGDMMDFEMVCSGFIGRALIFKEREDNPKSKKRGSVHRGNVPPDIINILSTLYNPGRSELPDRVERVGQRVDIQTRPDAVDMLDLIESEFYDRAENEKNDSGLTPIVRRGYELTAKISMILAIPEGVRTVEHVRWAYALIKRDIKDKILLTNSNSAPDKSEALASKIMGQVSKDHGETIGRLRNKCRSYRKEDVDQCVKMLVDAEYLVDKKVPFGRGRTTTKYFSRK